MLSRGFGPCQERGPRGNRSFGPEYSTGAMAPPTAPDGDEAHRNLDLGLATRSLAVLVAEGLSLGLCLSLLALGHRGVGFVTANALPLRSRALLLQFMVSLAAAAALA